MRHAFATLALLGVASAVTHNKSSFGAQQTELAQTGQGWTVNLKFENHSDETVQMYWKHQGVWYP